MYFSHASCASYIIHKMYTGNAYLTDISRDYPKTHFISFSDTKGIQWADTDSTL